MNQMDFMNQMLGFLCYIVVGVVAVKSRGMIELRACQANNLLRYTPSFTMIAYE